MLDFYYIFKTIPGDVMYYRIALIVLTLISTAIPVFFSLFCSMESPPYVFEKYAIISVPIWNGFWYFLIIMYDIQRKNYNHLRFAIAVYLAFFLPFVALGLYSTSFDSNEWKIGIETKNSMSIHTNGRMVSDLVKSKLLIGLPLDKVIEIMGTAYSVNPYFKDSTLEFTYSHQVMYDGCTNVRVVIINGICVDTRFGGCD